MLKHPYPYLVFSVWSSDPDNEHLLDIFRYVCGIINPLISDICEKFGYQGYHQAIKSLIVFFGMDEDPELVEDLIRIFPLLHDAGLAACSPLTPASCKFNEVLQSLDSYWEITPELCSEVFGV